MPAPCGDFSFFPNWGIESRILLSYKPLSLSQDPRDVNHFQPPGPLAQIQGPRTWAKENGVLTCVDSFGLN